VRNALFRFLVVLATRWSAAVLLCAFLLTAASLAVIPNLEIRTNFKDLLGPDDPIAVSQSYAEDNFAIVSSVRVVVEGRDPDRLVHVATDLRERLLAHPDQVDAVFLEQPLDFFLDHALLFLPVEDLRLMEGTARSYGPRVQTLRADPSAMGLLELLDGEAQDVARQVDAVARVNSTLFGELPLDMAPVESTAFDVGLSTSTRPLREQFTRSMIRAVKPVALPGSTAEISSQVGAATDVLELLADVLDQGERLTEQEFAQRIEAIRAEQYSALGAPVTRYRMSPNEDLLLMDVVAVPPIQSIVEAGPFLTWLEAEIEEVRRLNPDVTLRTTGLPVVLQQETQAIISNFMLVTGLGFIGILAVFIIGFERVALPSLAAIPLLMGTVWTFGLVAIVRGEITLFALTFPVLLMGIGIDFAIHMLSGYAEQRREGMEPEAALRAMFDTIGSALLTGALTTAFAFLLMMTSAFYGLRDMGFTAGFGVLLALLSMLVVLPAVLIQWEKRLKPGTEVLPDVPFTFLAPMGEWLRRNRFPVLAAAIAGCIALGYAAPSVRMDTNYMNALPQGLPAVEAQNSVLEKFGVSNELVLFFADDLEQAEQIRRAASEAPSIAEVLSPSSLIPADQDEKAPLLASLGEMLASTAPEGDRPSHTYGPEEVDQLRTHLAMTKLSTLQLSLLAAVLYGDEVQAEVGRARDAINRIDARLVVEAAPRLQYLDSLIAAEVDRSVSRVTGMLNNDSVTVADLPPAVLQQLRGKDGKWLVVARAAGDAWDQEFRDALMADVSAIDAPNAGMVVAWHQGLGMLLSELPKVIGLTALVVTLLVLFDLRSLRATFLSLVPLVLGLLFMFGVMGAAAVPFNILSIVAIPIMVGIGIDSGVHVVHRVRAERSIGRGLARAGKPVLLTSMTTGIGFGSLMLSVHPGIWTLGFATTVGLATSLVVSLVLVPVLIAIFDEASLEEQP
jgi:predicted RND superfamily exporter protein